MTDGATRLVDLFHAATWDKALPELTIAGPDGWIQRTRAIEQTDTDMLRWSRYKKSDDAAVAFVDLGRGAPSQ